MTLSRHAQRRALFTEAAPAKLNLWLNVRGRTPEGLHALESAVTFLSLADTVTVSAYADGGARDTLTLTGRYAEDALPAAKNTALTAAALYRQTLRAHSGVVLPKLHIAIEKNIPVRAGLGGGSADAAALLRGLQHYTSPGRLPEDTLLEIAAATGADVPVCLDPSHDAIFTGAGEIITKQETPFLPPDSVILLVYPKGQGAETAEIFRRYREAHPDLPVITGATRGETAPPAIGENALEPVTAALLPVLTEIKTALYANGAEIAAMTGSGSCMFGLYRGGLPALLGREEAGSGTEVIRCGRFL